MYRSKSVKPKSAASVLAVDERPPKRAAAAKAETKIKAAITYEDEVAPDGSHPSESVWDVTPQISRKQASADVSSECAEFTALTEDSRSFVYLIRIYMPRTGESYMKIGHCDVTSRNEEKRKKPYGFGDRMMAINDEYDLCAGHNPQHLIVIALIDGAAVHEELKLRSDLAVYNVPVEHNRGTWTELFVPCTDVYDAFLKFAMKFESSWDSARYNMDDGGDEEWDSMPLRLGETSTKARKLK